MGRAFRTGRAPRSAFIQPQPREEGKRPWHHFADAETEARIREMTCVGSHELEGQSWEVKPGPLALNHAVMLSPQSGRDPAAFAPD